MVGQIQTTKEDYHDASYVKETHKKNGGSYKDALKAASKTWKKGGAAAAPGAAAVLGARGGGANRGARPAPQAVEHRLPRLWLAGIPDQEDAQRDLVRGRRRRGCDDGVAVIRRRVAERSQPQE